MRRVRDEGDTVQHLLRCALPVVAHDDADITALGVFAQMHGAGRGVVAHGVGDEVEHRTLDERPVAEDFRALIAKLRVHGEAVRQTAVYHVRHDLAQDRAQPHTLAPAGLHIVLQRRHQIKIVDEPSDLCALRHDLVRALARVRRRVRAAAYRLGIAHDDGERRAHIVRYAVDPVAPRPVTLGQRRVFARQRRRTAVELAAGVAEHPALGDVHAFLAAERFYPGGHALEVFVEIRPYHERERECQRGIKREHQRDASAEGGKPVRGERDEILPDGVFRLTEDEEPRAVRAGIDGVVAQKPT